MKTQFPLRDDKRWIATQTSDFVRDRAQFDVRGPCPKCGRGAAYLALGQRGQQHLSTSARFAPMPCASCLGV